MRVAIKLVEDGDRANIGLPDGPQRPAGAGDTIESAEKSGAFERLQNETRLRSLRAVALEFGFTHVSPG